MPDIRVVVWLGFRQSDVFHDLVFSFSRDFVTRQNDLNVSPIGVVGYLLIHEVA